MNSNAAQSIESNDSATATATPQTQTRVPPTLSGSGSAHAALITPPPLIHATAQIIFVDGLRLILQCLSLRDFKSTGVFRVCRHWWCACTTMKSLGLRDRWPWPNIPKYDMTKCMYPPMIIESPSLGYHCPQSSVIELHWRGDAKEVESMLNQLTSHSPWIEVLRVNTHEHSDAPQLISQLIKFRQLKTMAVEGHSLQPLLCGPLGPPDSLTRIEWSSKSPFSCAFGAPSAATISRIEQPSTSLLRIREFRHSGSFRMVRVDDQDGIKRGRQEDAGAINRDLLFQYHHYLPNLTNLEVNAITTDCIPLLAQFKYLRQLSFGLYDDRGYRMRMTPKILNDHRTVFSQLTRLELNIFERDTSSNDEPQQLELQWRTFFSHLSELTHLIISNVIHSLAIILPQVHHAPRLTTLTLNPATTIRLTWGLLSQLGSCHGLNELNIWPNYIDRPLELMYDKPIHYRHELLGRMLWPNLQRFYLDYTLYIFPPLVLPPTTVPPNDDPSDRVPDPQAALVSAALVQFLQSDADSNDRDWYGRQLADARTRHLAAGFSAETAPTVCPPPFASRLWLTNAQLEQSRQRLCALVGQPIFLVDDEWNDYVTHNYQEILRMLVEFDYRPTLCGQRNTLHQFFDQHQTRDEETAPLLQCLLEVITSCGESYAHACGELGVKWMCHQIYQVCEYLHRFPPPSITPPPFDSSKVDALIQLVTSWYTQSTGKIYVYPRMKQLVGYMNSNRLRLQLESIHQSPGPIVP